MAELKTLNYKCGAVKRQLKGFFEYVQDCEDDLSELQVRCERISEIWRKFEELQLDIECILQDARDENGLQELIENGKIFESQYYSSTALARDKLKVGINPRLQSQERNPPLKIKLPPLSIQPFTGNYEQWLSFKDSFVKAVHEQDNLPDIQKFQILRGLLKEDALKVISALEATEANYSLAWELLTNRYENKRLIINTHVKRLFELPAILKSTPGNLRSMVDSIRNHIRSLQSLDQPVAHWDTLVIYLVTSKLDNATREDWERARSSRGNQDSPTLNDFLEFLEQRSLMLEMTDKGKTKQDTPQSTSTNKREKKMTFAATIATPKSSETLFSSCSHCGEQHVIYKCGGFMNLNAEERYNTARKLKLCINCLKPGHRAKDCRSSSCRRCNLKHNTLLHRVNNTTAQGNQASETSATQRTQESRVITHCVPKQNTRVILSTAEVYLSDIHGNKHRCRALLDPGSQSNMLTDNFAERLQIKCDRVNLPISGVNQSRITIRKSVVVTLRSTTSRFEVQQECLLIPVITENIPQVRLEKHKIFIPEGIELADPNFNSPGPIDLLIGAGLFWKLLRPGENIANKGQPVFQNTHLGWIVGGEYYTAGNSTQSACHLVNTMALERQLENFWKIEEVNVQKREYQDLEFCETHFRETHTRDEQGRFELELPQNKQVTLGESFEGAFGRLQSLERRLAKQPDLKERYSNFLNEYKTAGHMSLCKETDQEKEQHYYLPHHPIIRTSSLTTKLRVVFDASAKTSLGTSLNDRLLPGPNLQNDIFNILLRFRMYKYVLTADVTQMFRQINVAEKDRQLQRILWRVNPEESVQIFTLNTVTYGTSCATFMAMRCLKELVREARAEKPTVAAVLDEDFYMDDLISGTNTLEEAIESQKQLTVLPKSGKFPLRKWRANDWRILKHLTEQRKTDDLLILNVKESIKTLGLLWNSLEDILQFNFHLPSSKTISKRAILSAIAQIYDPLGIIGPVLIIAKMMMQELWKMKVGWDQEVSSLHKSTWENFVKSLNNVMDFRIPRNVNPKNRNQTITLQGFCDASEKAYGACIYVLSMNNEGQSESHLLCSKSRVAPLKILTLPRLELSAALLLSRLVSVVRGAIKCDIKEIDLWSDSTIALCWIETSPINLKTFVSNRVVEIQELTHDCTWHHVPSKCNPADLLSRGVSPEKLVQLDLWWKGPDWLVSPNDWPSRMAPILQEIPEQKSTVVMAILNVESELLRKYSSFSKLQRVVAYCYRFIKKLKKESIDGPISLEELEMAHSRIMRWTQEEAFTRDIANLYAGTPLERHSSLVTLHPFLDQDGLIKVGGRLRNANIPDEQKHPVILPSKHPVTSAILREEHLRLLHCGPQHLLASIRLRYWPLTGGREARKVTRSCVSCFRYKPKLPDAIMADLPSERVNTSAYPFQTTGIDYAGPLQVRESRRRGRQHITKGYITVFTCFSTKAVHLELVSDLSIETFLAALKRFVARRGLCRTIYSDNATNFVGAARELQEVYKFLTNNEARISSALVLQNITWKFIPPRSPHFGGLWEAAVKSIKRHLYTVTRGLMYTFEEYNTLLVEIESILNSRPLMPMSSDPKDMAVLTPSHFLIGVPPVPIMSRDYLDIPDNHLSRWQHIQKLKQHFWKRWSNEYLYHLQSRSRWTTGTDNVKVGTIVLLVDDNQPPLRWSLGRILEVFPGLDGIVRVVNVKTSQGIFKRSIRKICVLPFES